MADLRMEYCISVTGEVRPRPEGTVNRDLATGAVEVAATAIVVLSPADGLPFMIDDRVDAEERIRLEYRYLDLRRPRMAANLRARSAATAAIRRTLEEMGFLEVETPTLIRSTPEGARDLLVPSRLQTGTFYALAPVAPALQAVADDLRGRALFPDRPLLSGRGLPGRSPARVHPARSRGSLLGRRGRPADDRSNDRRGREGAPGRRPCRCRFGGSPGERRWTATGSTSPTSGSGWR